MFRSKLRYLMLLASVGLLLILFNKYYIGMIFITVVMMPFFLFGLLSYCYGKVRAELVCITHVAGKDGKIPVSIQLINPTIFPLSFLKIYISYQNAYAPTKFKKTICVSLDYKTKTSVIFHMTSQYAGNMEITLEGIRIYDYMKLFSLRRKLENKIKVAILPSYYELEDHQILQRNIYMTENDNYSPDRKGDDPSEVFDIREYREGDRLQRVHWKLSMKQNQLMMKEFSDPINCRELLFINLNDGMGDFLLQSIDSILEGALSLSYSLIMKRHAHYLAWYDVEHRICRRVCVCKEKDLFDAVDGLLQAKPYKESVDVMSVYLAEHLHEQYSELFFISNNISVPHIESVSEVKAYNRHVIYMHGDSNQDFSRMVEEEMQKSYKDIGVKVYSMLMGNVKNGMEQLSVD
jgi:hypothetical protein